VLSGKHQARVQRGFTLVELMVTLAILGVAFSLALPSFNIWIQNTRIRTTAEAISAGLRLAKSEAVGRNRGVRFQLTDTLTSSCALSATGSNWVIDLIDASSDSVASNCDKAISDTIAPSILHKRPQAEGGGNVSVSSSVSSSIFNGLGRADTAMTIEIRDTNANTNCLATAGGKFTCLRVLLSTTGQIRMCNPAVSSPNPQAC
jgi:type IV fimbrial biogenesis protein FimT